MVSSNNNNNVHVDLDMDMDNVDSNDALFGSTLHTTAAALSLFQRKKKEKKKVQFLKSFAAKVLRQEFLLLQHFVWKPVSPLPRFPHFVI